MDYITRFDHSDVAIHMYKQHAFVLTNDSLCKIIDIDKLASDEERYQARRVLADALTFIYVWCREEAHCGLLTEQYQSWEDFFSICFTDIAVYQSNDICDLMFNLQKEIEKYKDILVSYTPLHSELYNSKSLLIQLAVLILLFAV